MTLRNIVILGSTGSIGRSCLDVIRAHPGRFRIRALAGHRNIDLLVAQAKEFLPEWVCVTDESLIDALSSALAGSGAKVCAGESAMLELTVLPEVDTVVNAVVGAAGLRASLATLERGRTLALANKESLVAGGPLFPSLVERTKAKILPIDSEHSAIWQALACGKESEIRRLIITASGGPFLRLPLDRLAAVTVEQALAHPTWKMGPKITIDSATMANKGLEVIEAAVLFSMPVDKISVVIHPQSIVHSMVEYADSSIIAQMSRPDMRLPIAYALFWPDRMESDNGRLAFDRPLSFEFEPPDLDRFRALALAFETARSGGLAPAVYNAANEAAVAAFLAGHVTFDAIPRIIEECLNKMEQRQNPTLDEIFDADRRARRHAGEQVGQPA